MNKLKVLELFAGVGTQAMALKRLANEYEDFNFEVVGISEINKFAIKSYNAIHGETKNFGDISLINTDELPDVDLVTYSFPCQDISTSGKQGGLAKGSGTRSGLLWECEKIIRAKRPKYLLMENVKNLVSKKHKPHFEKWIETLNSSGYTSYYACLNSKDFGVPQNRERIFMVSILGEHKPYEFPKGFELNKKLKDVLEDKVDDRYYLSKVKQDRFKLDLSNFKSKTSKDIIVVGNTAPSNYQAHKVISSEGICCTVMENHGAGIQIIEFPCICASRGRNPDNPSLRVAGLETEQRIEINKKGVSNTITTVQKDNYVIEKDFKLRKLSELETWRLMGISDEDFYKAKASGVSNTQLYIQSGNAIVVDVLYHIFKELFI